MRRRVSLRFSCFKCFNKQNCLPMFLLSINSGFARFGSLTVVSKPFAIQVAFILERPQPAHRKFTSSQWYRIVNKIIHNLQVKPSNSLLNTMHRNRRLPGLCCTFLFLSLVLWRIPGEQFWSKCNDGDSTEWGSDQY